MYNYNYYIMKRKFKQQWSTIPPISTKRTITSHLLTEHKKRPQHATFEIQVLAWDRHKNMVGLNRLYVFNRYPLNEFHS